MTKRITYPGRDTSIADKIPRNVSTRGGSAPESKRQTKSATPQKGMVK